MDGGALGILLGFLLAHHLASAVLRDRQQWFGANEGLRMIGVAHENATSSDATVCATRCIMDPLCGAYGYAATTRTCRTYSCRGDAGTLVPDSDWVLYLPEDNSCRGNWPSSCMAWAELGQVLGGTLDDGFKYVYPPCFNQTQRVYCGKGGWTRVLYKEGAKNCHSDQPLTEEYLRCMLVGNHTFDFGISSDRYTLNVDQSWLMIPVRMPYPITTIIDVFDCKTPTGTEWSETYEGGYLTVHGNLTTNGNWTTMHYGCQVSKNVSDYVEFRVGGAPGYAGEFIHGNCSDYEVDQLNSITSRWTDDNVRSFWYRSNTE